MDEIEVVAAVAEHLDENNCRSFVDRTGYPSGRVAEVAERLENCEINDSIRIAGRAPDIIGYTEDTEIFAIEAKGGDGIRKGIGQAAHYRQGVQRSYVAADIRGIEEFRETILASGLGVYAVNADGEVSEEAPREAVGATELNKTRRALAIKTSSFVSDRKAFASTTMPLNAFLPVVVLAENVGLDGTMSRSDCRDAIVDHEYGIGSNTAPHLLTLARTLQLMERAEGVADGIKLTDTGRMAYYLLHGKVSDDTEAGVTTVERCHQILEKIESWKYKRSVVYEFNAEVAAFLRDRYLSIPDVRLMVRVLAAHKGNSAELSRILAEIATEAPEVYINLFVDYRHQEDFESLMKDADVDVEDEQFQEKILAYASGDALYNFLRQIIHVGILTSESDYVHQDDKRERNIYYWHWDPDIVGDIGIGGIW